MGKRPNVFGTYVVALLLPVLLIGCGGDDNGANSSAGSITTGQPAIVVDHSSVDAFSQIPDSVIENIKSTLFVFHGCTNFGRQITTGMFMLLDVDEKYNFLKDGLYYAQHFDDLGENGDTSWTFSTRMGLDNTANIVNIVLWSWENGVATNTETGIDKYLSTLSALEADYPNVRFVYTTGHLDGTGETGNLRARNNQIREYCAGHDKLLFDIADIESHNPIGDFFADASASCEWCDTWCQTNDCPACLQCYQSHCLNCYRKAQAFWWMLARISGWE